MKFRSSGRYAVNHGVICCNDTQANEHLKDADPSFTQTWLSSNLQKLSSPPQNLVSI